MKMFGAGHGSGIRPTQEVGRRAKQRRPATGPTKYTDAQVAHAKWLLESNSMASVAHHTGMPLTYIKQLSSGVIRANVEPKETK